MTSQSCSKSRFLSVGSRIYIYAYTYIVKPHTFWNISIKRIFLHFLCLKTFIYKCGKKKITKVGISKNRNCIYSPIKMKQR